MRGALEDSVKRTGSGRRRSAGLLGALVRAVLLSAPLGAALALAALAGTGRDEMRLLAFDRLDPAPTGSIGAVGVRPSMRELSIRPNGGPCLRFPDGSQRGDC